MLCMDANLARLEISRPKRPPTGGLRIHKMNLRLQDELTPVGTFASGRLPFGQSLRLGIAAAVKKESPGQSSRRWKLFAPAVG